ncbi:MAG: aminoacyl-tRNA hydrolase [Pseudomonadota bacterium]
MADEIRVIAGLGNPGSEYEMTRHNAGFWFVDRIAEKYEEPLKYQRRFDAEIAKIRLGGETIWLIKPMAFMNLSGGPLRAVLDYYKLDIKSTLVAHDELDLAAGTIRLKKAGGHGGHNGLRDIIQHCGPEFFRLRLGIGHPGQSSKVLNHVLKRADAGDQEAIDAVIDRAIKAVPKMIRKGPGIVMNELNRKPKKPKPKPVATPKDDEEGESEG